MALVVLEALLAMLLMLLLVEVIILAETDVALTPKASLQALVSFPAPAAKEPLSAETPDLGGGNG